MRGPKTKKEPRSAGFSLPGLSVEQLERMLDFMAAHGLEEFEYEHGGTHIRLKRAGLGGNQSAGLVSRKSLPLRPAPEETGAAQQETSRAPSAPSAAADEQHIIKSPIVGTFYSAPSPDAPSFIKVGDEVHSGQVVCIVEAMKLMNEIEADLAGKVTRVFVENAQPVEYGQPLFAIQPAKK